MAHLIRGARCVGAFRCCRRGVTFVARESTGRYDSRTSMRDNRLIVFLLVLAGCGSGGSSTGTGGAGTGGALAGTGGDAAGTGGGAAGTGGAGGGGAGTGGSAAGPGGRAGT